MSTERTGGPPPIDHGKASQDTKAAREEKQKVEKVRAVDADEEAQKRKKFRDMMMGDEDLPFDFEPRSPSPFETEFYAANAGLTSSTAPSSASSDEMGDLGDLEDTSIPSPAYTPPPDVSTAASQLEDSSEQTNLPQSDGFWENLDFPPDQPLQTPQFEETPQSQNQPLQNPSQGAPPSTPASKKGASASKHKDPSPFGPPGKPSASAKTSKQPPAAPSPPFFAASNEKQPQKPSVLPGKMQPKPTTSGSQPNPKPSPNEKIASASPPASEGKGKKDLSKPPKEEESSPFGISQEVTALPFNSQEQGSRDREKESQREMEIAAPSLPSLPADVQPMAQAASTQAAPYLRPETLSLFYQMVGTIYVMTSQSGVSRTEIVLNNPNFTDSKFFGATITIEKYATAPDSFNVRLTGSQTAVTAFKENIPSLMTAFQNGNFTFRINRVEAEYSVIKPYFRRKEKGEDGQAGSGSRDRGK
jgi:hypothetical protein